MSDLYPMVCDERRRLADVLDTLTEAQWQTPSLCAAWTVRDVAAHLVYPATTSKLRVIIPFAKAGFNFDKFTIATAKADRRTGPELAKALRATAGHRFTPPGFGFEAPLTDAVAHGRDIGRALEIASSIEPQTARAVLDFLVSKKATRAFVTRGRTAGLRFEATDFNWAHGDGLAVRGPAEALIMAILGRVQALDDLSGDGVDTLRSRS